jgi:RNA polymerase sigma factor (sigma-70 family)
MTSRITGNKGITSEAYRASGMQHVSDRRLIDRMIEGDPEAKEEFVSRFRKFIYHLLIENGLSEEDREDLFQQVFVHLWEQDYRRIRQWKGTETFLAWLRYVVKNLISDHRRNGSSRREILCDLAPCIAEADENTQVQQFYVSQQSRAVTATLRRLSSYDAELVVRRFYYGQSYREMASAYRLTVGHLGVHLHRARNRLWRCLRREYPDLFCE